MTTGRLACLLAAVKEPGKGKASDSALRAYAGAYGDQPWGGETVVLAWDDGLAMLDVPTRNPVKDLVKLKKTGEHTFRRIRKDETLAEAIEFEMGPDGRAVRFKRHSNYQLRVR